jgi:Uncharacterized protein conserved in archaea
MDLVNDYSALNRAELELTPVGVKFCYFKPEGIEPLDLGLNMSLCEILRYCQSENKAFYFSRENNETCIGKIILGMQQFEPFEESGQIGQHLGVFDDARANHNLYQYAPRLAQGVANYVAFSPVDKLTFEPDVLVIAAKPNKAEIIMRAVTYSTGELFKSVCTPVMGCAWFLVHPFKTGDVNFIIPAFVHGPRGRELYSEDTVLVSIPYRWIPTVLGNLNRMDIHLSSHNSKQEYYDEFGGIMQNLAEQQAKLKEELNI